MKVTIEEIIIRYLESNATPLEKQELLSWLQESKEHERMFLVYYDIWSLSQQLAFDSEAALKKVYSPPRSHKRVLLWSVSIAASIAILVGIGLMTNLNRSRTPNIRYVAQLSQTDVDRSEAEDIQLILSDDKQVKVKDKTETTISYLENEIEIDEERIVSKKEAAAFNQLITPYGKRSTLVLEDGTKIWLNAKSRLIYPTHFADDQREVYIEGEIYLEVTPDKTRPFIVKTERMNVQVLGTSFTISAYLQEEPSRVILASGAVSIYAENNKKEKHMLSPNEMYELSANGEVKVGYVRDITKYTSWIHGIYQFEHESLSSILTLMERFYGKKIEFASDAGMLTCSGKLRLSDDFTSTLHGLSETLPINIEYSNNTYFIHKITE